MAPPPVGLRTSSSPTLSMKGKAKSPATHVMAVSTVGCSSLARLATSAFVSSLVREHVVARVADVADHAGPSLMAVKALARRLDRQLRQVDSPG
jgi:hypothetical protein